MSANIPLPEDPPGPAAHHQLSHLDQHGAARMVDVGDKEETHRSATASTTMLMSATTLFAIQGAALKKGDALAVARVAGILAAKRVDELIPLCHTVPLSSVDIQFDFTGHSLVVTATAVTFARTGVEMEALTACTVAALTIYDMAKALEKGIILSETRLLRKSGGKSGDFNERASI